MVIYFDADELSGDHSGSGCCMRTAVRRAYANSVPKLHFRARLEDKQIFRQALNAAVIWRARATVPASPNPQTSVDVETIAELGAFRAVKSPNNRDRTRFLRILTSNASSRGTSTPMSRFVRTRGLIRAATARASRAKRWPNTSVEILIATARLRRCNGSGALRPCRLADRAFDRWTQRPMSTAP